MKYTSLAIIPLFLFGICLYANAQSTDEQQLRKIREKSNEAIAKHDTASLALYWLDDVHVLTSRSTSIAGKLTNQRSFQQEFQTKEKLLYVRTPTTVEVFPNWNMAAEYGKWTGTWTLNGSSVKISGSYYAKWHKLNGQWKIRSELYTPALCEGGEYCQSIDLTNNTATIVVQNFYFPKAGKETEVLAQRKLASEVRAKLGLSVGRILLRTSESTTQPYLVWECEYPSLKAREDDVAKLDHSAEFTKVQEHMSTLLDKFDRSISQIVK